MGDKFNSVMGLEYQTGIPGSRTYQKSYSDHHQKLRKLWPESQSMTSPIQIIVWENLAA